MEYKQHLKSKKAFSALLIMFCFAAVCLLVVGYYARLSLFGFIGWLAFIVVALTILWSNAEKAELKKFIEALNTKKRGVSVVDYDFLLINEELSNDRRYQQKNAVAFYKELRKRLSYPEKYLKKEKGENQIKLAQVAIPQNIETLHFAISASTGAGKSVALRGMLRDIARRGDRAIVIDNGGEFSKLFKEKDSLYLSPFDQRSQHWDMKNEVKQPYDWMRLAKSIVPDASGSEKSWHDMAQKLIANIGLQTGADNKTLLEIATSFTPAQLEPILQGTSSAVLLQEGGERLLTNIRSVFATYMQCWQFMQGGDFSIRDYVQGSDPRWLWIPFQESELGVSKDLIASWLDVIVSAGLERAENSQMTWVFIDELDTLGCIGSLIDATTKLRKRNMPIVTAFQSYSQLESNYGKERAATLFNCFSSKLILRTVDGITAEHLSKELGDAEKWKKSYSVGQNASHTESLQIERAVLPSEIQGLPDLQGFLKLAGDYPIIKTKVSLSDAGIQ